jgi:hypothetical protein
MYDTLKPGDVVLADALFDDYFLVCELRQRGIELVARAQHQRVGTQIVQSRPDGDVIVWQRPNKPHGMKGEQYRTYPKTLLMRQVSVDARDKNNRVEQFNVITTILDVSIDGGQIGDLFERRWEGEVDLRSIKSTMRMDVLRCKTPEMVRKEIWAHLLAYNLLRTVMAVAAAEHAIEPRQVSFKGAKQAVTAFAPKIEAARPERRPRLIDALLRTIAYHRVGDRPGRWEPRARKRRPTACRWRPRFPPASSTTTAMLRCGALCVGARSRPSSRSARTTSGGLASTRRRTVGANRVERCVNWLKESRALATRFDKLAVNYLATAKLGILQRFLRKLTPNDLSDRPYERARGHPAESRSLLAEAKLWRKPAHSLRPATFRSATDWMLPGASGK